MRPSHLALGALLAVAAGPAVSAQFGHPLTDIPSPLDGVTTAIWFPKSTGFQFTAGETVEAIISVRNEGKLAANVSSIMGSLNDAAAFHLHYQNFSFVPAQGVPELAPGVEVSVPYFFTPAPSLPEHAFQVALTVFMVGEGGVRAASTPFNRTIDIVAPVRWIDFEMLGLWAALAGLVAGLGWVGYHSFGAGAPTVNADGSVRKARPAASRPRSSSTAAPADPAAWLKGTNFAGKSK